MALQILPKPEAAIDLVGGRLARMAASHRFLTPKLSKAEATSLAISTWLPSHLLLMRRLPTADSLQACCRECGWTFLVHSANEVVAIVEARCGNPNEQSFGPVREGPCVDGLVAAITRAEELSQSDGTLYQPALLFAAPLNLRALWLRHAGGADWIIPFPPLMQPTPVMPLEPLRSDAFVAALRSMLPICLETSIEAGRIPSR